MRGEYRSCTSWPGKTLELPPRARRIRIFVYAAASGSGTTSACAENTAKGIYTTLEDGTTSACAENTTRFSCQMYCARNYLRVRGEYTTKTFAEWIYQELPPRARRILFVVIVRVVLMGTTSACAENTFLCLSDHLLHRNYLRVRGEYFPASSWPW